MFQMQDFENYKRPKKSICTGLRAMISPHQNCHFGPSFIFFKKCFSKKFKKNAVDMIRNFLKDESNTSDSISQLQIFFAFSRGVTPFCKNKGSQKQDPSWNFFCSEPLKCLGPNTHVSENMSPKKLN